MQMPTWLDEQYTLMSGVTLLGLAYILWKFAVCAGQLPRTRMSEMK